MSATPNAHPSVQRLNKAFVQVPASPQTLSSYQTFGTPFHVAASSKLKENTPLRPLQLGMNQQPSGSISLKRKLSDRDSSFLIFDGVLVPPKKSKLSFTVTKTTPNTKEAQPALLSNKSCPELFPNGFVYCHQCNRKRDPSDAIRCTVVEKYQTTRDKNIKERPCAIKYCKFCLKNRYEEDIEVLRSTTNGKNETDHLFQCPRCRDVCNCPRCMKSKGLEPTGKVKPKELLVKVKAPRPQVTSKANTKEPTIKAKRRDLPTLKWKAVSIRLTQVEAEERIFLREFVLRFANLFDPVIAKANIEELELIGGKPGKSDDEDEVTGWVSDACVKALVTGLLGLLAKDQESEVAKRIKITVKDLRSAGFNLNKIWNVLLSLREDMTTIGASPSETPLTLPDPSPPPNSAVSTARSLRSLRQSGNVVNIVSSSQMIPVLVSMAYSVLATALVREELDQGAKDAKDMARDAKEATRIESERWEKERTGMEVAPKDKALKTENRAKRTLHKDQIANIDNSMKVISTVFAPRFLPLGTDLDDRIYYALSPGVAEREAAFEYIELAASETPSKPKKKGRILSSDDRQEMREWSWFVGVWGKKPPSLPPTPRPAQEMDIDDSENDSDAEKWWGFWEPEEIFKVAEWISIKAGLDDDEETTAGDSHASSSSTKPAKGKADSSANPRTVQIKRLVTELKDYAALLHWRTREDKSMLVPRIPGVPPAKSQEETASTGKETPSL